MITNKELIFDKFEIFQDNFYSIETLPFEEDIKEHLIETKKHVINVEYCIYNLGLDKYLKDPQRPHDITGAENKYDWNVLKGMSLMHRNSCSEFNDEIRKSIELHRNGQYHHIIFNEINSEVDSSKQIGELDLYVGAIDAVCSLSENRKCYGGKHSFEEIIQKIRKNPIVKSTVCLEMLVEIMELGLPQFELNGTLDIPKIFLPQDIMDNIQYKTIQTIDYLSDEKKYNRKMLI